MKRQRVFAATVVLTLGALAVPVGASAPIGKNEAVPEPTAAGPITGGGGKPILVAASLNPAAGYVGEEFFLDGTATSFDAVGKLARNGKWKVKPADTAPFATRIVVYRPASADDFSGTVFVEWLNVTAGFDTGAAWTASHTQIIRSGAAWVGVSAQSAGIQGDGESATAAIPSGGLKVADAARYADLDHPGDAFSYDIFSQTGVAVRTGDEPKPLGDLVVERVIAMGESQSAFRMVTYINAVHPRTHVFDGFLVYSRGGSAAGFTESKGSGTRDGMPEGALIRADVDVPVLMFETETDLTLLGYLAARQRDTKQIRLWEVAGTSHADAYTAPLGFGDADDGTVEAQLLDVRAITGGPLGCTAPINAGPMFAVLNAAVFQLERWVRDGTAPPRSPRMAITSDDEIARDEHGNAKGGIRTPQVDVPIATLTGQPGKGERLCVLFGRTLPFDDAKLVELYPAHADYAEAFNASADAAVEAGFWMEIDAEQFKAAAANLPMPGTPVIG
ncbi:MAG: hypothetical protein EXQ79_00045 [Acidimicrobiia bacterium]|nr:hypothetical protein [Acidimicrobiia bacterium]